MSHLILDYVLRHKLQETCIDEILYAQTLMQKSYKKYGLIS